MKPTKARMRYLKKLYCIVKRDIDTLDVYHLLENGAPPDEFDIETKDICKRIMDANPDYKDEIVRIIQDVFWHWMDIKLKEDLIIDMAADIYEISHTD